jgi:hypothetical protein
MDIFGVDKKLQHKLCHADADIVFKRMTAPPSATDKYACIRRATLLSGAQKGGRRFWMILPADHHLTLTNEEFYIYVRLRLSLPSTATDLGRDCSRCSARFDTRLARTAHLPACHGGKFGGTTLHTRHDSVRSTFLDFLRFAGIMADPKEPRGVMYDARTGELYQGGTDIAAFGVRYEGDEWQFDVHLLSSSVASNTSSRTSTSEPQAAAAAGELSKMTTHLELCKQNHVQFLPLSDSLPKLRAASLLVLCALST